MELDGRQQPEGAALETDVCIVGAGPAGVALAHALSETGGEAILLESGAGAPEPEIEALADGTLHAPGLASLRETRARGLGGTTRLWNTPVNGEPGAKLVPLDAVDFEERGWLPHSGWPFGSEALAAWYERARLLCGLGPLAWDAAAWARPGRELLALPGPALCSRVYRIGVRSRFPDAPLEALRRSEGLRVCHHATVRRLLTGSTEGRIEGVEVMSPGGPRWTVRARRTVLAAGAIENARLLLLAGDGAPGRGAHGPGNASGWLGRGFMEHPRDRALTLLPASRSVYERLGLYDLHEAASPDGPVPVLGRLALREEILRGEQRLNASATLWPRLRPAPALLRRALAVPGLGRLRGRLPDESYGWSQGRAPGRWLDGLVVLLNLEQAPHRDNRVRLAGARDALGLPRAELWWRWRPEEQARLERLRALVARELEATGLGRVVWRPGAPPDPNAHHHAGTTRMHADPAQGVVDADGRVHGTENLYVCGASTFPTAGFANPVLTIVALALRLADHLRRERGPASAASSAPPAASPSGSAGSGSR